MSLKFGWGILLSLPFFLLQGQQGPQPEPLIRNLSIVALDSRGQPVNDLTAGDFIINDSGKTQKIAFVRHIERRLAPAAPLRPGEYSNRTGRVIPHATVILLDLMNQSFSTRGVAASQLTHYLQTVEGSDYLYLYFLTIEGRVVPVRGIPEPGASEEESSVPWTKKIKPIMDEAMKSVLRLRPVDMDVAVRTQLTFRALEALGNQLAGLPGRKNVVWISDGVPIVLGPMRSDTGEVVDFTPWLRKLSQALDRSEIAIYPVPQIMIGSSDGPPDAAGVQRSGPGTGMLSQETLNQFADMTGGRAHGGKDIAAAITQAMYDARTSYQLGYFAADQPQDGKFHKLRITCARKGVKIQAKTGYYAWAEDPSDTLTQGIRNAASQPLDATEIGIRAMRTQPSDGTQHFRVVIDAKDVTLLQEPDRYTGHLTFSVVGFEARGAAHPSQPKTINLAYTAQERDKALSSGIEYPVDIPADASIRSVRFIAFDDISHSIGSLTIPVIPSQGK